MFVREESISPQRRAHRSCCNELLKAKRSPHTALAAVRSRLREILFGTLPTAPEEAAALRAMLLGDRSFLHRSDAVNFEKTGVIPDFLAAAKARPRGHFIGRREFLWTSQPATHRMS
jgi:hypothetical protein